MSKDDDKHAEHVNALNAIAKQLKRIADALWQPGSCGREERRVNYSLISKTFIEGAKLDSVEVKNGRIVGKDHR